MQKIYDFCLNIFDKIGQDLIVLQETTGHEW